MPNTLFIIVILIKLAPDNIIKLCIVSKFRYRALLSLYRKTTLIAMILSWASLIAMTNFNSAETLGVAVYCLL